MWAKHPEMARRWQAHTPKGAHLPQHVQHKAAGGLAVSTLADLAKYLRYFKAGDRPRVERALQYAPDLPRQFQPDVVRDAIESGEVAAYRPSQFERLAYPMHTLEGGYGDISNAMRKYVERDLPNLRRQGGFTSMPFLQIEEPPMRVRKELGDYPYVAGHEGRHRSRAMAAEGMPGSLVSINQTRNAYGGGDYPYAFRSLSDMLTPEMARDFPKLQGSQPLRASDVFLTEPFADGGLAQASKRAVNAIARQLQRARAKPVVNVEASTTDVPLSPTASDYAEWKAFINAPHNVGVKRSVGQGAWAGDKGMEYNRMYSYEMPPSLRTVANYEPATKLAAEVGAPLKQQAVGIARAMPSVFDIPEGADALLARGVSDERIKRLAERLGPNTVVSQRPRGEALLFSLGDEPIEKLRSRVEEAAPAIAARYAVSRPGKDRALVTQDEYAKLRGYASGGYVQFMDLLNAIESSPKPPPAQQCVKTFKRGGLMQACTCK